MPRSEFNVHFASRGRGGHVRAEEALGIALLVIILAAILILGCYYFSKRRGYKIIRNPNRSMPWSSNSGQYSEEAGTSADNKFPLRDLSHLHPVVPNAPPAYEKIASTAPPPPYSP
ncbi:melanoma antigen recognized by T-cells 1 [Engraulis encrasicolus]|uniref:melanoma antigen recognized by T-cells 1 n=1 Tax=Engraulis encrasicolus TaxID=184585 RepID=UPI002FD08200